MGFRSQAGDAHGGVHVARVDVKAAPQHNKRSVRLRSQKVASGSLAKQRVAGDVLDRVHVSEGEFKLVDNVFGIQPNRGANIANAHKHPRVDRHTVHRQVKLSADE